jgi:hypothetical protein
VNLGRTDDDEGDLGCCTAEASVGDVTDEEAKDGLERDVVSTREGSSETVSVDELGNEGEGGRWRGILEKSKRLAKVGSRNRRT